MAASMQDNIELNRALDYLVVLSKQDPAELHKKLYDSFSALAYLAVEGKDAGFKKGWAADLKDRHDVPLFTKDEADIVETVSMNTVKPLFEKSVQGQAGGAPHLKPMTSKTGMIQRDLSIMDGVNPEDLSIDAIYWKINDFFANLDKQTHDLSRELGPFRFFYETSIDPKIPIPYPLPAPPFVGVFMLPIPSRAIPLVIEAIVEAIRLVVTMTSATVGLDPKGGEIARKILSIVMALIDLFKGEWKHALLSFAGYYGQYPLIAGIIGKVALNIFSLIAPDLQERLIFDVYQSSKSLIMGGFLWAFSTLSPDFVRKIVRVQFDKIKELADNSNEQITKVEESMQKSVAPLGLKIDFSKIPEDFAPTFDDIQNLQAIARQPNIFCSKEFQEAIAPIRLIPPARFILEMMSIPTTEKSVEMECRGMAGVSLDKTMDELLSPKITADPDSPMGESLGVQDSTKVVVPESDDKATPVPTAVPTAQKPHPTAKKATGKVKKGGSRSKVRSRKTRRLQKRSN
jgi:hypothetical protein